MTSVSAIMVLLFAVDSRYVADTCSEVFSDNREISRSTTIVPVIQGQAQANIEELVARTNAKKGLILIQHIESGELRAIAAANGTRGGCFYNQAEAFRQWEPGSVVKSLTVAAAIDEGRIKPSDSFYNSGSRRFGDTLIANALNIERGSYTFQDMLSQSINLGAIAALESLSDSKTIDIQAKQTWYRYMTERFGFGQVTEAYWGEDTGYLPDPKSPFSTRGRYAFASYGIGFTTTPIQITSAYAALVNKGEYAGPTLWKGDISLRYRAVSSQTSTIMTDMLQKTVEKNNAIALRKGYVIGGKSGTGPSADQSGLYQYYRSNGVYVGYVGRSEPEYIVMVKVDEPEDDEVLAGRFAANLWAKQVGNLVDGGFISQ